MAICSEIGRVMASFDLPIVLYLCIIYLIDASSLRSKSDVIHVK
jgi:hypothetical protein